MYFALLGPSTNLNTAPTAGYFIYARIGVLRRDRIF